jgi:hypothetical protein
MRAAARFGLSTRHNRWARHPAPFCPLRVRACCTHAQSACCVARISRRRINQWQQPSAAYRQHQSGSGNNHGGKLKWQQQWRQSGVMWHRGGGSEYLENNRPGISEGKWRQSEIGEAAISETERRDIHESGKRNDLKNNNDGMENHRRKRRRREKRRRAGG